MRHILLISSLLTIAPCLFAQDKPSGPAEHFVFSTNSEWSPKQVKYDGSTFKIKATKKCKDEVEAPGECYWIGSFFKPAMMPYESDSPAKDMPKFRCSEEPTSYTVEDLDMDGTDEIIVITSGHGSWVDIHVFTWGDPTQTSGAFWYEPVEPFAWYAGTEGDRVCDAQVYWVKENKELKVLTTEPAEEDFKCSKTLRLPWVLK
ncbi:MAG: hypothetical protein IPN30_01490 [Flavobacteriales bacterium]|nr:hypothetical protein [Flavobacteriales bacterium]